MASENTPYRLIEFTIVGLGKGNRPFHDFQRTDKISLEREPKNPVDPHAIKVLANGEHAAYVSKEDTKRIRIYMNKKKFYCHEVYLIDKFPGSLRALLICIKKSRKSSVKKASKPGEVTFVFD